MTTATARKLIIISATILAIVVSVVSLIFIEHNVEPAVEDQPTPMPEVIYIFGGVPGKSVPALTVEVTNKQGTYKIINTNPDEPDSREFILQDYEQFSLQISSLFLTAESARSLTATTIISDEAVDLDGFGLGSPAATVKVDYVDGTSAVLHLGAQAPGGGVYAMREGSPRIYLITQAAADQFLHSALSFIDLNITEMPEDMPEILRAVLGGKVRQEPIVIEELFEEQKQAMSGGIIFASHQIVSPINVALDSQQGLEQLFGAYGLTASSVEGQFSSADELTAWGLLEPYSTIEIESREYDSFKLICSEPDEDGMVYLVREGLPFVYRISRTMLPWFDLDVFTMMDKSIVLPFVDDVSTIEVYTPEQTVIIELRGKGNELEVTVNGVPYETTEDGLDAVTNFRALYTDLLSASYYDIPDELLPPSENEMILLRIVYNYRDGRTPDTIAFYESAIARRVLVSLNGRPPMLALTAYVDHIYRSVESFLAGTKVVGYM